MCETMEHIFFDSAALLQSDAYRIGRRTRSATRDEEALDEIEAIEAHLSFADHQRRAYALADALSDGPPVTLDSLLEESAVGEYQLFVTEIHQGLLDVGPAVDSRAAVEELAADFAEAVASSSEPSSPAIIPTAAAQPVPSAAAMFRAASAAAASPTSVVGPRRRRTAQSTSSLPAPSLSQQRSRGVKAPEGFGFATFDSIEVTSDGDDSFDGTFDEINIEITDVTARERYTTVITAVTPMSPPESTPSSAKRRNNTPSSNKRGNVSSPATPGKRGRRTTTTTTTNTTYTVIETTTNYLEAKPSRTGSYAGEEVLRISSVVIEETDVDILN